MADVECLGGGKSTRDKLRLFVQRIENMAEFIDQLPYIDRAQSKRMK
jgi:hypothetical protein